MKRLLPFLLCALLALTACTATNNTGNTCTALPDPVPEAAPEADQSPESICTAERPDFQLKIDQPEPGGEKLTFTIVNSSGADAQILLIPTLEQEVAGGWETVPFSAQIGFCGTQDPLPAGDKAWSEDLSLLWGSLPAGEYRLSYTVTDSAGQEHTALGTFSLPAVSAE